MNLGFDHLLGADIHLYLLRFRFGLLGEANFQHALVIVRAHLPRIDGTGECERTGEASVLPLDTTEVFLSFFFLDLALAMDGEGRVLDADINVFFIDARDLKLQSNIVLVFVDIHRRCNSVIA